MGSRVGRFGTLADYSVEKELILKQPYRDCILKSSYILLGVC